MIVLAILGTLLGIISGIMLLNLGGKGNESKEKKGCSFYIVAIVLFIISFWLLAYSGAFDVSVDGAFMRRP